MINSINIISRSKNKNINEITLLNIGAKAKVNNVQTNKENKTDEEEEERQTRGNMAGEYRSTIIRNFTSVRYVLREMLPPLPTDHLFTTFVRNVRQSERPV